MNKFFMKFVGFTACTLVILGCYTITCLGIDLQNVPNESAFGPRVKSIINSNNAAIEISVGKVESGTFTNGLSITGGDVVGANSIYSTTNPVMDQAGGTLSSMGDGIRYYLTVNLNERVAIADNSTNPSWGSTNLLLFPEGWICIESAVVRAVVRTNALGAGIASDAAFDISLGTVAQDNATHSSPLAEANIMPASGYTLSSGAIAWTGIAALTNQFHNGTSTRVPCYLNITMDNDNAAAASLDVTGRVFICYRLLGDY